MLLQGFYDVYLIGAPFETCMRIHMVWHEKGRSVVGKTSACTLDFLFAHSKIRDSKMGIV